jgi:hypothetical protein
MAHATPGWGDTPPCDLTSATDARTTRLRRTLQRRSSARRAIAHELPRPAFTFRADAAASTASHPNVRDDRDTPLSARRDGENKPPISEKQKRFIFRAGAGHEFTAAARRANQLAAASVKVTAAQRFLSPSRLWDGSIGGLRPPYLSRTPMPCIGYGAEWGLHAPCNLGHPTRPLVRLTLTRSHPPTLRRARGGGRRELRSE